LQFTYFTYLGAYFHYFLITLTAHLIVAPPPFLVKMHKLPTATPALHVPNPQTYYSKPGAYCRYFLLTLPAQLIVAAPTLTVENAQTFYSHPLMLPIAAISLFYAQNIASDIFFGVL